MRQFEWIKWTVGFGKKLEVLAMADALKVERGVVATACMEFWEWTDANVANCNALSVTESFLDSLVSLRGWTFEMVRVGWLHRNEAGQFVIPNWERHNGKSSKSRALTYERVTRSRESETILKRKSNAASVTKALLEKEKEYIPPIVPQGGREKRRFSAAAIEGIYQAYPRKIGKLAALKAIQKALHVLADSHDDPAAWLLARVQAYAAERPDPNDKFTPHPATWFNRGSYDDAPGQANATPLAVAVELKAVEADRSKRLEELEVNRRAVDASIAEAKAAIEALGEAGIEALRQEALDSANEADAKRWAYASWRENRGLRARMSALLAKRNHA